MSCFGRFARFRANRFRGRVGDESVSVGDESVGAPRTVAAGRRRARRPGCTLGRSENASVYRVVWGVPSTRSRAWRRSPPRRRRRRSRRPQRAAAGAAGSPCGTGGRLRGGAGAGEPRPDRERVFLHRDTRSTMSRRFVRASVRKTATRRTRDVEQVRRAFRERVAKRASLRRRPRQPQRARPAGGILKTLVSDRGIWRAAREAGAVGSAARTSTPHWCSGESS